MFSAWLVFTCSGAFLHRSHVDKEFGGGSDHQWSEVRSILWSINISITSYGSDAKLTYLNGLSELQVERNDARALQAGGEAGPPPAAFRAPRLLLLLVSGRTGTVKWVHHDRTKTAAAPRITIRASIIISGQKPERAPPAGQERINPHTPLLEPRGITNQGCRLLFIYFTSFYWFLLPVTPTNTSTQVWSLIRNKSLLSVTEVQIGATGWSISINLFLFFNTIPIYFEIFESIYNPSKLHDSYWKTKQSWKKLFYYFI